MSPKFFATFPSLEISGVLSFTISLFNELSDRGFECELILTGHLEKEAYRNRVYNNFSISSIGHSDPSDIKTRYRRTADIVNEAENPVLLPGYDFDFFHFLPWASSKLKTIVVIHSDENVYYENCAESFQYNSCFLPISEVIENAFRQRLGGRWDPNKVKRIPVGIKVPAEAPIKPQVDERHPIKVIYSGRISNYQKRIFDLAEIVRKSVEKGLNIEFHIAGKGPEELAFKKEVEAEIICGAVVIHGGVDSSFLKTLYKESHCIILTSDFEGLPISLQEGMSHGCVPVTSNIKSGIPELIDHGENGFIYEIGSIDGALKVLRQLSTGESLKSFSSNAFKKISESKFNINKVAQAYVNMIEELPGGSEYSPSNRLPIPPRYQFGYRVRNKLKNLIS